MRGRSERGDLNRTGVVLSIGPLFGIKVVLTHVAHATAFVVPISAMSASGAPALVGFPWRGPAIQIPIQLFRNGLGRNSRRSAPLLDLQSSLFHADGLAILEQPTGHDFVLEDGPFVLAPAEPAEGTDLKYPAITLECVDHGASFGHEAGHGLFTENVHAGFCRCYGDTGVPMGRGGDGDQVEVFAFK